jgi:AcrR family transcriptional regulator
MRKRLQETNRRQRTEMIALEAAQTLGENGCFRFRVDDVAERVGVAKGTVYLAFSDKRDLIGSAFSYTSRSLLRGLEERLSSIADPGERLRAALEYLAAMPAHRPEFEALLDGRLACSAAWIGARTSAIGAIASRLEELVREARDAGSLPIDVDPPAAAQLIMAIQCTAMWREGVLGPAETIRQASLVTTGLAPLWSAEP